MNFDQINKLLNNSPSITLLHSRNAALILGFLYKEFQSNHSTRKSNTELVRKLAVELEEHSDDVVEEENKTLFEESSIRAKKYLESWTNKGYLLKTPDEKGEHWHELTSDTSKTLLWIEDLLNKQKFVGTNSRFKDIFQKIESLVKNSNADPDTRVKDLENEIAKIQNQINRIKSTGVVDTLDKTRIEEEFSELNRQAKSLLADFREVEDNFKGIARDIYEKQSAQAYSKGGLLGLALDSWAELRTKDQGRSFYAFWEFLQSDASKEEFKQLVDALYLILTSHNINSGDDHFLKHLKRYLHDSGKKVLESNDKLAEKLNRLLAEKSLLERRRAMELIQEIRLMALKLIDNPPQEINFIEIEIFEADLNLPLARKLNFGQQEDIIRRQPGEIEDDGIKPDFGLLYKQFVVDKRKLENQIKQSLEGREEISLGEVISKFPIEKGLSEIITYFSIATQNVKAKINEDEQESVIIDQKNKTVSIPKVIFKK
jgi:hypothetical protein